MMLKSNLLAGLDIGELHGLFPHGFGGRYNPWERGMGIT